MFIRKRLSSQRHERLGGFTLIELAIVLGVVGVLGASLWRLMSTSNQQSKDLSTAQQQQQLIASVKGFLASTGIGEGQTWLTSLGANATATLPLPTISGWTATSCASTPAIIPAAVYGFCNFLPAGFYTNTANPYGQTYSIQVLKDNSPAGTAPQTYSFMIIASGTVIPDIDGGRISGMIGGDGGFIYSSGTVCGATSPTACGALGAWQVSAINYGFTAAQAPGGAIASRSFVSPSADNSNLWLAREVIPSDTGTPPTFNTMTTNLYMGASATAPSAATTNIYMADGTELVGTGSASMSLTGTGTSNTAVIPNPIVSLSGYLGDGHTPSNANPLLNIKGGPCNKISTTDSTCQFAVQIAGDVALPNNMLIANQLFALNIAYNNAGGSSDRRLKKDIQTLNDPLSAVLKMNPVSFTFKQDNKKSMGVIAQEMEKIYPELVMDGMGGYKAVNYNALTAPLIGAVQELKKENDELRAQLQDQAARQQEIEQDLAKLKDK